MTPDDGQKTCPKHVEFYSKNKFEKLVYLFGFIIRSETHPDSILSSQQTKFLKHQNQISNYL